MKRKLQNTLKVATKSVPNINHEVQALRRELGQKRIGGGMTTHTLYVTRCGNEPLGAAKKYPRITAVETIETTDPSLEGLGG